MRVPRNLRLGVKNLWLHRLRSMLTMLGVVFGVASVVAMLAVGEGASAQALEQIRRLGSNNIILRSFKPTEDEKAGQRRSFMSVYGLTYDDEARLREFPSVRRTVPVKLIKKTARVGERALDLRVVGTTPQWFELVERDMIAGRLLTQNDIERHAAVCVLTETGARRLLATHETIGKQISIEGVYFEVAGIVTSDTGRESSIQSLDGEVDAYIPIDVARERFGEIIEQRTTGSRSRDMVELHEILVECGDLSTVEDTAKAIDAMLRRFHKKNDFRMDVPLALLREAEATKKRFNIVLGSIAGISLLVGGIGIMNIMLASVTERTREIGVRRAIGARRRQIVQQFLIETLVLSLVGGLLGVGLGVAVPSAIERFAGMPTVVTSFSILMAVGISAGVGIVFGLYPAVRAANLDPIEALRHE